MSTNAESLSPPQRLSQSQWNKLTLAEAGLPHLREPIRHFENLGGRLRRIEKLYAGAELPQQEAWGIEAVEHLVPSYSTEFLNKQLAKEWHLDEDEIADLPPLAQRRMRESHEKRIATLWPAIVLDEDHSLQHQIRTDPKMGDGYADFDFARQARSYINQYHLLTSQLEIHPLNPHINTAARQRIIDYRARSTAQYLIFFENLRINPSIEAGIPHLLMAQKAQEAYGGYDILAMQQAVMEKARLSTEKIAYLQEYDLWEDTEDLTYMLLNKEVKDAILTYYGFFREVQSMPSKSGYRLGQEFLHVKSIARGIARVET